MKWTLSALAHLTLQISFVLYLSMILSQVVHNLRRRSTAGLSWIMHVLILSSYICDMGYGLGTAMPWQYYSIAIIGTSMLILQQFQFWYFRPSGAPRSYVLVTLGAIALLATIVSCLMNPAAHQPFFTLLGFIAVVGWNLADLPQLIVNRRLRSTQGLSPLFILFGIFGMSCDIVSAYGLNWGLPNKVGAPIALCLKLILLYQAWRYRQRTNVGDGGSSEVGLQLAAAAHIERRAVEGAAEAVEVDEAAGNRRKTPA